MALSIAAWSVWFVSFYVILICTSFGRGLIVLRATHPRMKFPVHASTGLSDSISLTMQTQSAQQSRFEVQPFRNGEERAALAIPLLLPPSLAAMESSARPLREPPPWGITDFS